MANIIQTTITPAERARRVAALEQAEHSGEMEGLHVTPAARADGEEYAAGRIDIDELVARGRARYGVSMASIIQTTITPVDRMMAEVQKGQQLAGHFPDAEALDRGQRVYRGELSIEDARAEIETKYLTG